MLACAVLVAIQLFVPGLYLPPVFDGMYGPTAPNDHFATGPDSGVVDSGIRRVHRCWWQSMYSYLGLYRPPVLNVVEPDSPPQTIISLPLQTAVCHLASSWERWTCW